MGTLATVMTQSFTWHKFCDHLVEELQASACCFVFFGSGQPVPILKSCRVWPHLAQWQQVDFEELKQQGAFYEMRANYGGAYLIVPIVRKRLSGLLIIQYDAVPNSRRSLRALVDIFAHHGALLWQEQVR